MYLGKQITFLVYRDFAGDFFVFPNTNEIKSEIIKEEIINGVISPFPLFESKSFTFFEEDVVPDKISIWNSASVGLRSECWNKEVRLTDYSSCRSLIDFIINEINERNFTCGTWINGESTPIFSHKFLV